METIVNFYSSIKAGSNIKLLPVSDRQCFVFTPLGNLIGCIVLGDLTHFIGLQGGKAVISAHEYIITVDLDSVLIEWDYQPFTDIQSTQWLHLVSYNN